MSQKWEQGSAARQPSYDEASNPFTPVDYAARLNEAPRRRSAPADGKYQPGQLYGYTPPVSSPPPAAAPRQELPPYMQPNSFDAPPLTPGAPYGANAYHNGPMPYPQAFEQPKAELPQEPPLRDAYTPAQDPKPLKKIREADRMPQRAPVRVGRVAALIAAVAMILFCALAIARIALTVRSDDRSREAAEQSYLQENGVEMRQAAVKVELPPDGQTFEPTAAPPSTPAPEKLRAAMPLVSDEEEGETEAPVLRTKLTTYPKNPLCNVHESLTELIKVNGDVIGRLSIGGVVDEVVVQRNNTYYLTHNYTGTGSDAGAVFADEACTLRMPPENLLLRGQSAVGGKVFAPLWQFVSGGATFAASAATAQLTTLYEQESYVLFAVILADSDPKAPGYFNYASHPTFATDEDMMTYVQSARQRSLYPFSVDVQVSDRLLTLATLGAGEQTVILMYRMARDGENY